MVLKFVEALVIALGGLYLLYAGPRAFGQFLSGFLMLNVCVFFSINGWGFLAFLIFSWLVCRVFYAHWRSIIVFGSIPYFVGYFGVVLILPTTSNSESEAFFLCSDYSTLAGMVFAVPSSLFAGHICENELLEVVKLEERL